MRRERIMRGAALALLVASWAGSAPAAETIRIGISKIINVAPVPIALAKGYFTQEGLDPQLVFFESQAPVAVAVASGDLDVGTAAETAALYTLSADGREKIIASGADEAPSFKALALVASNQAYAAGLKTPRDLPGHSFALTQMGTGLEYSLGLLAKKDGFSLTTMKLLPLQSNPNIASALIGGRADAAAFDSTNAMPLLGKGQVKLLGWMGDLTGYTPAYLTFASRDMVDHHPDTVRRFLAAFRDGARDYFNAFTDAQDHHKDGPTAPAILAILSKFLDEAPATIDAGLPYFDREARVDVAAVQDQLDWYHSIGGIKNSLLASEVLDKRYVRTMPGQTASR